MVLVNESSGLLLPEFIQIFADDSPEVHCRKQTCIALKANLKVKCVIITLIETRHPREVALLI